ncbi:unnamed protein product [Heterobilharzia americana]|nr:unnamed protein product [Heterobilharzia americana]
MKADMFYGGSDSNTLKSKGLLTMLNVAADEYSALQEAVRDAMKFYAELTEICLNTQSKIEDFCAARTTEKNELMSDITSNLSRVRVSDQQPMPKPAVPPVPNAWTSVGSQGFPMMAPGAPPYGMAPYPAMYPYYGGYAPMPMPSNPAFPPVPMMPPHHMGGGNNASGHQGQYLPGQPSAQP